VRRQIAAWLVAMSSLLAAGCTQWDAPPPRAAVEPRAESAVARTGETRGAQGLDAEEAVPIATLAALLRDEDDPDARREAVFQLADPDPEVRRAAVEALTGSDADAAVSYLALALNDPDPGVRLDATEALGSIGSANARAALQQAALDMDPQVRAAAERMLAEPERKAR
jgi:HEAT repeat protein